MELGKIYSGRRTGEESLHSIGAPYKIKLIEFWQWSSSDLVNNVTRGKYAEFLVATDLGVSDGIRAEWDPYDLTSLSGHRIEVKTSAYLQSWAQTKFSAIIFDIAPKVLWNSNSNTFEGEPGRHSDFYVFCLLHHKDKETIDPLDTSQWTFYVIKTGILDDNVQNQKSISLAALLNLNPTICEYGQINSAIENSE